jgi:hypothetical protein
MKRAVIIGNGFDLAIGAKTSFSHFLQSKEYADLANQNSLWSFCEQNLKQDRNWSDLEGGLVEWAEKLVNRAQRTKSTSVKTTIVQAKREFEDFSAAVREFVRRSSFSYPAKEYNVVDEVLKTWLVGSELNVLNFNYTGIFKTYTESFKGRFGLDCVIDHQYVHGSLVESDAVFGTVGLDCPDGFEFMAKQVRTRKSVSLEKSLRNSDELIFYGHSFGLSDFDQIHFIFKQLDDDVHSINKVVCYTLDEDGASQIRANILKMSRKYMSKDIIADWRRTGKPFDFITVADLEYSALRSGIGTSEALNT